MDAEGEAEEEEDSAGPEAGQLRGTPGKRNAAYMVFGIRFIEGAKVDQSVLNSLRIVAFASSGFIDDRVNEFGGNPY